MTFSSEFVSDALCLTGADRVCGASFDAITPHIEKTGPGTLYLALTDHVFDAHAILPEVLNKGAAGIVVERELVPPQVAGAAAVRFDVPSTWRAFMQLGRAYRPQLTLPVVAVIGSVGKTTTKELLGCVLTPSFPRVHRTARSENGAFGIPKTLLEVRPAHDLVVVEIGIDEPGAMQSHVETVRPDHLVVTCLGPEHLDRLQTPEIAIREESIAIHDVASRGGLVVLDLGDPIAAAIAAELPPATVAGFDLTTARAARPAAAGALHGVYDEAEDTLSLPALGATLPVPLPGRHNARNLLAAATLGHALGVDLPAMAEALANFRGAPNRSAVEVLGSVTILRDFYNANPTSVRAALELMPSLARRTGARRIVACLGDMLDLGAYSADFHHQVAAELAPLPFAALFAYGDRMAAVAAELARLGFAGEVRHFSDRETLAAALRGYLRPRDLLLMKASAAMKMNDVWDILARGPMP